MNPPYKAIFFDAAGTLFRVYPSVGLIYSKAAVKYGVKTDPEKLDRAFRKEFEFRNRPSVRSVLISEESERLWWRQIVWNVFRRFGQMDKFEEFFDELYELFATPRVWRLYPEAKQVIKKLRRNGFVLGIISNWDARLLKLASQLGLAPYLDFIVISSLVGSSKPDSRIFKIALKKARVKAGEAIHVGDRFRDDYLGAKATGIRPILINRNGNHFLKKDRISSLQELLPLVGLNSLPKMIK